MMLENRSHEDSGFQSSLSTIPPSTSIKPIVVFPQFKAKLDSTDSTRRRLNVPLNGDRPSKRLCLQEIDFLHRRFNVAGKDALNDSPDLLSFSRCNTHCNTSPATVETESLSNLTTRRNSTESDQQNSSSKLIRLQRATSRIVDPPSLAENLPPPIVPSPTSTTPEIVIPHSSSEIFPWPIDAGDILHRVQQQLSDGRMQLVELQKRVVDLTKKVGYIQQAKSNDVFFANRLQRCRDSPYISVSGFYSAISYTQSIHFDYIFVVSVTIP